ncbi:MAG: response regulator [Desulfobacteraceae bacterium]|jgi:putative nucleotidyltransferase with HDIG domain
MMNHEAVHEEMILVVDDDQGICSVLQAGTQMAGYNCSVAHSPAIALDFLEQYIVDVVVADIKMPGMSGIELAQIIKRKYTSDVIIMTGFIEDFNYEDIVRQGASDFLQKPVRIPEFIARLKRVLSERSARIELKKALEEVKHNLVKLRRAMEGTVQAISTTVEMRDPYTAGHQQRVADLACAIAEAMGLGEDEVYGLRMASVIHDLGKITVPSEILSKPGQLSSLEYELIKSHVQAGYDILKQIDFPWPLADIILQHHERLDGSGYPNGLKDDQIMLAARILSVSDVFETIASHRPYRPSLGLPCALDELRANSGKLYDPQVVEACLALIEQGRFELPK